MKLNGGHVTEWSVCSLILHEDCLNEQIVVSHLKANGQNPTGFLLMEPGDANFQVNTSSLEHSIENNSL